MLDEDNHSDSYTHPANGQVFPRLQIVTTTELLAGKRPNMPGTSLPYIAASKAPAKSKSAALF